MIILLKNQGRAAGRWTVSTLCFLLAILPGCLDVIDIRVPDGEQEKLVIQGKLIVGNPSTIQVLISRLFDFTAAGKRPVTARAVTLLAEDGNSIQLEDDGLGNYSLNIPTNLSDFEVVLEKNYWIRVETFDGRVFESSPEKGIAVPQPDNLTFQVRERSYIDPAGLARTQDIIQFSISTPLQNGELNVIPRVGWQLEWTFKVLDSPFEANITQKTCYVTQQLDVSGIKVLNAEAVSGDYLREYPVYENEVTRNFAEGLTFTAIQESLSETAYTYFDQIAQNVNRTGNMFETPPGAVITNIRNIGDDSDEAFGFFYVTQQDTIRQYIRPADVGSPAFYCPPPGGLLTQSGFCADFICCDCLSVENSTTEVPDFWEK